MSLDAEEEEEAVAADEEVEVASADEEEAAAAAPVVNAAPCTIGAGADTDGTVNALLDNDEVRTTLARRLVALHPHTPPLPYAQRGAHSTTPTTTNHNIRKQGGDTQPTLTKHTNTHITQPTRTIFQEADGRPWLCLLYCNGHKQRRMNTPLGTSSDLHFFLLFLFNVQTKATMWRLLARPASVLAPRVCLSTRLPRCCFSSGTGNIGGTGTSTGLGADVSNVDAEIDKLVSRKGMLKVGGTDPPGHAYSMLMCSLFWARVHVHMNMFICVCVNCECVYVWVVCD